jgi:uncharacterized membrane protein
MSLMKLRFPTDRVIFFSDAVFAIAMTLLILEVKLPSLEEVKSFGVGGVLMKRLPNFIGYIISFFVTALFWKAHVQLGTLVKTVTPRFFWLNVWLLFFVVLMPFSTAMYSNYFGSNIAFTFYCINLGSIGFFIYLLTAHVHRAENLATQFSPIALRWHKMRALMVSLIFGLCIPLAYVFPNLSRYGFFLIFVIHFLGDKYYQRKLKVQEISTLES